MSKNHAHRAMYIPAPTIILRVMDTADKLRQLGAAADLDVAAPGSGSGTSRRPKATPAPGVCHVAGKGGSTLLRVLMTDRCEHDCHFCPLRASAPRRRTAFEPEELARLFRDMHGRGIVDGLFLSSAVDGTPDATMERMLAAVEIMRTWGEFDGYIHLKLLPGVSNAAVELAARLASRVSINVEAPNGAYLEHLGTGKDMARDILRPMRLLHRMEQEGNLPSGVSTQYVVGAAGESDREIVSSVRWLSEELGLRRAYFGLYRPSPDDALVDRPAAHPNRQARLYQADWLTRMYGLPHDDIADAFDPRGNLPLGVDPKVSIALARPERFPLDVNHASREDLLRVPGIGPVSADRIVTLRRAHRFTDLTQLKRAGVAVGRAAPFVLIDGRQPIEARVQHARLTRQRAATPAQFGVQLGLPGFE